MQFCRDLTKSFEDVYVFTVPLFLPKRDGRDGKWRVVRATPASALDRLFVQSSLQAALLMPLCWYCQTYEMTGPQGGAPNVGTCLKRDASHLSRLPGD